MANDKFITVDDLCKILSIGKNTAYELLKNKEIRAFRIGRTWKIPKESVDIYVNKKISMIKPFTTKGE